jgi:multiple sugar transport system permease protein/raffinose/stachyose/melibiose transport system permease protein
MAAVSNARPGRGAGETPAQALSRWLRQGGVMAAVAIYTLYSALPFLWVGTMSVRTTSEISAAHFAWPETWHWDKFRVAWVDSNFAQYFWNSVVVVSSAVAIVTLLGAAAAHCLARYNFRGNRLVYFVLFSSIVFPPQIILISLFQVLVEYDLYNSRLGLTLVYVSLQLPLTVYLLEAFFARIPQDLFDAAKMDGYTDFEIFRRIVLPVGMPAIATTVILNFIQLWNEFLFAVVLLSDQESRTLPLGIRAYMGDYFQDIGMIATGMMIAVIPVVVLYAFFSEKLIQGMTAGAVK